MTWSPPLETTGTPVSYPAAYPHAIAVAATQFDETTTFYSNWGKEIDIAAPGGNTRVDQNGDGQPDGVLQHTIVPGNTSKTDYLWFMGTSMASPHAAGVAALIMGTGVRKPELEQAATIASIVMDLDERRLWITDGYPCSTGYREVDYSDLLAKNADQQQG